MKIGIIGLPQVGKKTMFGLLTGQNIPAEFSSAKAEVRIGSAVIRDTRFDKLVGIYKPKKKTPATIDVVLLPKFDKETVSSGEFLRSLESCDVLCHIVRAFADDSVFHVDGSVDAMRDIENVYAELILGDLIFIEKRLERLSKELMNKSSPQHLKEKEILSKMKELLDQNKPLITFKLSADDSKLLSTYKFLTRKPMIVVLNVSDDKIADTKLLEEVSRKYGDYGAKAMQVSAKIEAELSSLDENERATFLKDLNIKESALNKLSRLYYEALGLISFFTAGEQEVRAWAAKRGSLAPQAAGVIHSDMERGFIRAEIIRCDDLFSLGSEAKVREAGKFALKGKDYTVEDGDIMYVRFNV